MEDTQTVSKRGLISFWVRLITFLILLVMVLGYASYVLVPKNDFGICSIVNLYRQDKNTVDVLVLGTSMAYTGVNTNILWSEYGIAAYNLCSAEQSYWISYCYLKEAIRTQAPKLIILDAKASIYMQDYTRQGRTIMSTSGIMSLVTRLEAIRASVAPEDFLSYALSFPQSHNLYSKLTLEHFRIPPDNGGRGINWKGYIESDEHESHERPSLVWTNIKKPMHPRQKEYFEKILELAQAKDIPVALVGFPNPDYASDHMYYNALWHVAAEYGVSGINYNDPDLRYGLRYSTDFADWQHLNVKGAVTFSKRLGLDLKNAFDLPDRRDNTAYESYEACADDWYEKYPQYAPETISK